jgi:hypothetical protein
MHTHTHIHAHARTRTRTCTHSRTCTHRHDAAESAQRVVNVSSTSVMTTNNRFLDLGGNNTTELFDGTANLYVNSIKIAELVPNEPIAAEITSIISLAQLTSQRPQTNYN